MAEPEGKEFKLPLIWHFSDDIVSKYATNLLVQHTEHEFIISFFETRPPVVFGPEDLELVESVQAECVARIIVAADRMPTFVKALQTNLENYLASVESEDLE